MVRLADARPSPFPLRTSQRPGYAATPFPDWLLFDAAVTGKSCFLEMKNLLFLMVQFPGLHPTLPVRLVDRGWSGKGEGLS